MKAGFYKFDYELKYAERGVYSNSFQLDIESKSKHKYPVDGWHWFDSDADARKFFGLPEIEESTPETAEIDKHIEVLQAQKTELKIKTAIDRAKIIDAELVEEFKEAVGRE
jgi:hypothetical protein